MVKIILEVIKKESGWWVYQKIGTRTISCAKLKRRPIVEDLKGEKLMTNIETDLYADQVIVSFERTDKEGVKTIILLESD